MNSTEAIAYLKSIVPADDAKAQEAISCFEIVVQTAIDLARLRQEETEKKAEG